MAMNERSIDRIIKGQASSDGAGVRLKRSLGQNPGARLDPFLMLDEFRSEDSADYIGGFPDHPHRGFETVTYMLAGAMEHRDSLGNQGLLQAGDVQWMTAASGIVHSEMPQQKEGLMHGFQLWINLPASEKMKPPRYQDIASAEIPDIGVAGGRLRVVAGSIDVEGQRITGPVGGVTTEPLYIDVTLEPDRTLSLPVPGTHNALIYVFQGVLRDGDDENATSVHTGEAGLWSSGDQLSLRAGAEGGRCLLLAARPLNEPVAQYGPFVMNSREEIEQALSDFRAGRLAESATD